MNYLIFLLLPLFFIACDKTPQARQYTEIVIQSPDMPIIEASMTNPHEGMDMSSVIPMPQMPVNNTAISWQTPNAWQEQAGGGMRIASFISKEDSSAFDCSIVILGGSAGGVKANLIRWMGQIQLTVPDTALDSFIEKAPVIKTNSNLSASIYDFNALTDATHQNSILAAVIELGEQTVFIKMTAPVKAITEHRENFINLVRSIKE